MLATLAEYAEPKTRPGAWLSPSLSVLAHVGLIVALAYSHWTVPRESVAVRARQAILLMPTKPRPVAELPPAAALPRLRRFPPARAVFRPPNPTRSVLPVAPLEMPHAPSIEFPRPPLLALPPAPTAPAPPLKTNNLDAVLPAAVNPAHALPGVDAGFGAASAAPASAISRSNAVTPAGFGDAAVAASGHAAVVSRARAATPVEILSKPRPEYSDEARRLHLEGEVLVEVLFSAAGEARVLRVLRGLGHGLDENAIRAAQSIRFRPAESAGVPVDATAIVHITFQLAF